MSLNERTIDIEKQFLSYLFFNKKYISLSREVIKEQYLPNYNNIYHMIITYYDRFKDVITNKMIEHYFTHKKLDENTIASYKILISEIKSNMEYKESEFEAIQDQLIECFKRKKILNISERILKINPIDCDDNNFKELEDNIKHDLTDITNLHNSSINEGSVNQDAKDRLLKYNRIKSGEEVLNLTPSGFKHIDENIGGFAPGELIYIIGRKGAGKSVLMLNLAYNFWKQKKNIIIYSLEMDKESYQRRFDALAANVNSTNLKLGTLTDVEEKLYTQYIEQLSINKYDGKDIGFVYIVDTPPGITTNFIESQTEKVEQKLGVNFDVIISDYAGIMRPNVFTPEKRLQQSDIALDLKTYARKKKSIVISAAQENRKGSEEKDANSNMVAESDGVSDHIDYGIRIRYLSDDNGEIQSFKTRDSDSFRFSFERQFSKFKIAELQGDIDNWDSIS